jgi:hypothetical protein
LKPRTVAGPAGTILPHFEEPQRQREKEEERESEAEKGRKRRSP